MRNVFYDGNEPVHTLTVPYVYIHTSISRYVGYIYTEIKVSQAVTHHFDITTLNFFFIILFHFLKMLVLMD